MHVITIIIPFMKMNTFKKKLLYPPFTNLASVILSGTDDSQVISKANEVLQNIYESFKGTKGI